jgi:hypothetical protein
MKLVMETEHVANKFEKKILILSDRLWVGAASGQGRNYVWEGEVGT